jgi:membrane-bound ClpP family serine protease
MNPDALLIWGLALLAISVVLLVVEVFVPSGGIIAVVSGMCAIGGVGMLWKYDTTWGITGLLTMLVLGPMALAWAFKMLPHTPIGRAILGGRSAEELEQLEMEEREHALKRRALVGATGVALTDMRPVGEVEIDGEAMEAFAEHDWIEAGDRIVVTNAGGLEIKVRRA